VRVHARGCSASECEQLLETDLATIRARLGRVVFGEGDQTLAEAVSKLLVEPGLTVSTAESCSGGLLAKQLTDVPGSSAYFLRGYVTYSNDAKCDLLGVPQALIAQDGAVSESVARAMAGGCRAAAGTDIALSITGIAGPAGGVSPEKPVGLVYIGLVDESGAEVKRMRFGQHLDRAEIRDRSVKTALNLLRLRLMDRSDRR
jgi:nicotinamide-nucleotide amidase